MSDKKINVTLKSAAGYDAPWVTVGGDSEAEVAFGIKALLDNNTFELVVEAAKALQAQYGAQGAAAEALGASLASTDPTAPWDRPGVVPAPAPAQPDPWSQPAASAPAWGQPPAAPAGVGPQCKHGAMTPRSGNKNGRAWSAHFCPTPKGTPDQCDPIFGRG